MIFSGKCVDGLGTGAGFVRQEGYLRQFREKTGIEALFPGTLNVEVDLKDYSMIVKAVHGGAGVLIEGFMEQKSGKRFHPVKCLECKISGLTARAFIVLPQKSKHEKGIIEIVSEANIRNTLGLDSGSTIELEVPITRRKP